MIIQYQFRRPEFVAEVTVESASPHWFEQSAIVKAKASYYAGGSLADSGLSPAITL